MHYSNGQAKRRIGDWRLQRRDNNDKITCTTNVRTPVRRDTRPARRQNSLALMISRPPHIIVDRAAGTRIYTPIHTKLAATTPIHPSICFSASTSIYVLA